MGIDLTLLPARKSPVPDTNRWSSDAVLPLTRGYALWELIADLPSRSLGAPLFTPIGWIEEEDRATLSNDELEEDDYPRDKRSINEDVFELPLRSVAASDLVTLRNHQEVQASFANRAAWVYITELPPDARIVLYWC